MPSRASGLRLAAATAAGSGTPDATRFRTAVSRAMTDPASVEVPARVTRCPTTSTSRPPIQPAPIAHPGERDGVADEQQPVRRLQPRDERPQRGMDVDAVGDELDVGRVVEQGGHGDARAPGGRRRSSR